MNYNIPQVWNVNKNLSTPLFKQLADNIKWSICLGNIPDGWRLPPVRQMSTALSISIDTVRAAYKLLEEMGLVITRPQHGTVVIKPGEKISGAPDQQSPDFTSAILNYLSRGHSEDEIETLFKTALDKVVRLQSNKLLFIECDPYDEITLCRQLQDYLDKPVDFLLLDNLDLLIGRLKNDPGCYKCIITTFFHYATVQQALIPFKIPVYGVVVEFNRNTVHMIADFNENTRVAVVCKPQHSLEYMISFIESIKSGLNIRSGVLGNGSDVAPLVRWADVVFATHPCEKEIQKLRDDLRIYPFCDQINAQSLGILRENLKLLEGLSFDED